MTSPAKKAFITGITGFVGRYLSEHLNANGWSVFGLDRWPSCEWPNVTYFEGDLLDTAALAEVLLTVKPAWVFHLAAVAAPSDADLSPRHALNVNIMGTASLLDAVRQSCPSSKTLIVGSSKQYGMRSGECTIAETTPCSPTDFYGLSKFSSELIGIQYVRQYGMDVRFTRSFNHTGPGQSPRYVCSDWAKQTAEIEQGTMEPVIHVGNLDPVIDFSDVRDVVRAYTLILEKGVKGEAYNVCSGKEISLRDILSRIIGLSEKKIVVETDKFREKTHWTGFKITGNHAKLTKDTGWLPEIPIEKTLDDIYRYWLSQPPTGTT